MRSCLIKNANTLENGQHFKVKMAIHDRVIDIRQAGLVWNIALKFFYYLLLFTSYKKKTSTLNLTWVNDFNRTELRREPTLSFQMYSLASAILNPTEVISLHHSEAKSTS